jgi:cell division protein FtsB
MMTLFKKNLIEKSKNIFSSLTAMAKDLEQVNTEIAAEETKKAQEIARLEQEALELKETKFKNTNLINNINALFE